jgi:hypothetical protein
MERRLSGFQNIPSKIKAIRPAEKPQPTVIKPAPSVEPAIDPELACRTSIPIGSDNTDSNGLIAPKPDSDPEPKSASLMVECG